jgi:hypothetical protein
VPAALRSRVINHFHSNPESSHFRALKTAKLTPRDMNWPAMELMIRKYIVGCKLCQQIKAPPHTRHGLNTPLSPPSRPWERLTMDFVTDLAKSMASEYSDILVIVDCFTKIVIYLPCRKDIDSPQLAQMFFKYMTCKRGGLDNITTDRGKMFTTQFWARVYFNHSINHRFSTAFLPPTDGPTELHIQTMKQ